MILLPPKVSSHPNIFFNESFVSASGNLFSVQRKQYAFVQSFFPVLKTMIEIRGIHEFILEERHSLTSGSSHQRCSVRKSVLRNFAKFTGKHLCQSLFFNKFAGLRPAPLLKKRLWVRFFPVNFVKFVRTLFESALLGDCF